MPDRVEVTQEDREAERLKRIEAMTTLSLIASLYAAGEQHRHNAWKRKLKDALWPLI